MTVYHTTRVDENGRVCTTCGVYKLWSEFYQKAHSTTGYKARCKDCDRNADRETRRAYRVQQEYDLTPFEEEQYYVKAGYKCQICRKSGNRKTLNLDHCHTTHEVRGVLCGHCNSAIGFLKDNPESVLRAFKYLTKREAVMKKRYQDHIWLMRCLLWCRFVFPKVIIALFKGDLKIRMKHGYYDAGRCDSEHVVHCGVE